MRLRKAVDFLREISYNMSKAFEMEEILMGLFNRSDKEPQPRSMQTTLMIRVLAVGYILYMLYNIVKSYFAGGADAPSLTLLLVAILVLGGGSLWVAVVTWKDYKAYKAQEAERQALEEEKTEADQQDDTL